jgi:S-DNA-T family DNA segregation ATPase FtsK/SpoIIIE
MQALTRWRRCALGLHSNPDWRAICERGRALREAARTLDGHAAGDEATRAVDPAAVIRALGAGPAVGLPEPLTSVVEHLGEELNRRPFVPTAELVAALGVEPTVR